MDTVLWGRRLGAMLFARVFILGDFAVAVALERESLCPLSLAGRASALARQPHIAGLQTGPREILMTEGPVLSRG